MVRQIIIILSLLLSSCVYTLGIQQGNILDQKDINKLRAGLTKNQVVFVLGNPVVNDSFSDDHWTYLYTFSNRMNDTKTTKRLELNFSEDKLVSASGDFEIPEDLGGEAKTVPVTESEEPAASGKSTDPQVEN